MAISPIKRLAKNALFPTGTSLLNKVLDMAFAVVMLRVLQPDGVGQYAVAVILAGYFDILVNFGLPTLTTRDVSRSPSDAGRYLGSGLVLRYGLWIASLPLVAMLLGPGAGFLGVNPQIAAAVWLLMLAMLPSIFSTSLTALFMAYERMEVPAFVTVGTTLLKIGLGLAALLGGYGFVGLAAVAVLVNVLTAIVLLALFRSMFAWPTIHVERGLAATLLVLAFPLMLNSLLNSLFFRIDQIMLNAMVGDVVVGYYNSAYRIVDGLLVVSSSFTLALFPMVSRLAMGQNERLQRVYELGLKVLLMASVPMAVGATLLAEPLMRAFAGDSYLPHAAVALQVLVWFLPFSFANGLTQYVLITLNRQRFLTVSFFLATVFNVAANLYLIPRYGYLGAATSTIFSEIVLLGPFWIVILWHLPGIPLMRHLWRPALAAALMAGPVLVVREVSWVMAIPIGIVTYLAAVLLLRGISRGEVDLAEPLIGPRVAGWLGRIAVARGP